MKKQSALVPLTPFQIWKRQLGFTPEIKAFHKRMSPEDRLVFSLTVVFEHKRRLLVGEIPMEAFDPVETFRIEVRMLREKMRENTPGCGARAGGPANRES